MLALQGKIIHKLGKHIEKCGENRRQYPMNGGLNGKLMENHLVHCHVSLSVGISVKKKVGFSPTHIVEGFLVATKHALPVTSSS